MNINSIFKKVNFLERFSEKIVRFILVLLLAANLYPLVFVVITSLKTTSEFMGNIWSLPRIYYWQNYAYAWINGHIGEYFVNSIIVTLLSLVFIITFSSLAGYSLAKLKIPLAEIIASLMLVLIIFPQESLIIPLYIFMAKLKLIKIIYLPMILAYIGWCMPFSIIVLKNFFQTLSTELLEAARIDGCSEVQTLFRIAVPLMTPAIATCTVFNFCYIWGELMWAQVVTASVNFGVTLPAGLLSFKGQYQTDWGPMTAGISIILIPLFIVFLFLQKYFIKGLTAGSVKG